ncbi:hypothetical protein BDV96DRAFT_642534 [Lophiotrema nucula]|uniref:Uncharacterized protein n=1 Tax=Lophiotrema nucula TaxID=690887 RepID=A0A6A5ZKY4_9PLEO|nr:hypothetical protein BDV96DRAFT_642534 [Lophiotrema nucula]
MSQLCLPVPLKDKLNDEAELEGFERWRQVEGAQLHPGMNLRLSFDKQKSAFNATPPCFDLEKAIAQCRDSGIAVEFDVSNCTREDVFKQMRKAEEAYELKAEKLGARAFFRQGTCVSNLASPWTSLVPSQFGSDSLAAGLALVFQASRKREENREKILQTFQAVVWAVEEASHLRILYPSEATLKDSAIELYAILTESLQPLIQILLRTGKRRHKLSFSIIPSEEGRHIDNIVNKISIATDKLDNCVKRIERQMLVNTHTHSESVLREAKAVRQTSHLIRSDTKNVLMGMSGMEKRLRVLEQQNADSKRIYEDIGKDCRDLCAQIQTGVYRVVLETDYKREIMEPKRVWHKRGQAPFANVLDLTNLIDVPPLQPAMDVDYVVRKHRSQESGALSQAQILMSDTTFKHWLGGGQSRLLVVDGHLDRAGTGKLSPVSVFCGSLIIALLRLQEIQGSSTTDSPAFKALLISAMKSTVVAGRVPDEMRVSLRAEKNSARPTTLRAFSADVDRFGPN